MSVSKRLETIVSFVQGRVLADIGCDHAYVVVQSLLENRVQKAYACDVSQGPLERARANIEISGCSDKVQCLLMNGLDQLPFDVDVIVIAGMGGLLIREILTQGLHNIHPGTHLVLSPHKDGKALREYLSQNGFVILQEKIVEDGHFYPVLNVLYDGISKQDLSLQERDFGVSVIVDSDYRNYLHHEKGKWQKILNRLPDSQKEDVHETIKNIEKMINDL